MVLGTTSCDLLSGTLTVVALEIVPALPFSEVSYVFKSREHRALVPPPVTTVRRLLEKSCAFRLPLRLFLAICYNPDHLGSF